MLSHAPGDRFADRLHRRYAVTAAAHRFRRHQQRTQCPYARHARIWGGLDADGGEWGAGWADNVRALEHFVALSRPLDLAGFALPLPTIPTADVDGLARTLRTVLTELSPDVVRPHLVERPEWRFSFRGVQMFVAASAGFYPANHSRCTHLSGAAFLFFQPMHVFDPTGPLGSITNTRLKQSIRARFRDAGCPYDESLVTQPLEALRYVKPLRIGDEGVAWWTS